MGTFDFDDVINTARVIVNPENSAVELKQLRLAVVDKDCKIAKMQAQLDEANENLVSMVNQYCAKTTRTDKVPNCYSHMFMSTGEAAFEYLVNHGLAKWCENGVDICDLKWPSQNRDTECADS